MKEIAAGGVVFQRFGQQLKLLVIEDRFQRMTIPKGKQEAGESLEETALREIKEETGIEGEIVHFLTKATYNYKDSLRGKIDKEVSYYLIRAISGQLKVQIEEINGAAWLELKEAKELLFSKGYENNQMIIEQACQYLLEQEL